MTPWIASPQLTAYAIAQFVEALPYEQKGLGFDSRWGL
jgi:hypothetical protein